MDRGIRLPRTSFEHVGQRSTGGDGPDVVPFLCQPEDLALEIRDARIARRIRRPPTTASRVSIQRHVNRTAALVCRLNSVALQRPGAARACKNAPGREWALVDTRGCDPGSYFVRTWMNAAGRWGPVESPAYCRCGGAIGQLTLVRGCVAVGPCPSGVDEGAGLLLMGFKRLLAVPLASTWASALDANWLFLMSSDDDDFGDSDIEHVLALTEI